MYMLMSSALNFCFNSYSGLLVMSYCTLHRKGGLCMLTHEFCVSRKGGTGGSGWGHPQGTVHTVAARPGCKMAMVGTGWANFCPGNMNKLGKCCSHLVEVYFRQGRLFGF